MNKRDIIMLAIGLVTGCAATAAAGYFGVYRKYIPLHDLEHEIGELEDRKRDLCRQIDTISDAHDKLKKDFEQKETEMDERLKFYENELDSTNQQLEESQKVLLSASRKIADAKISYSSMFNPGEPEDESDEEEIVTGDHRFVINTGYSRVDGVVSEAQQAELDSCESDEERQTVIDGIIEERFDDSIDDDEPTYHISKEDHDSAPWFIDTMILDYYEADDIVAEDRRMLADVDTQINPIVLNRFGPHSQSGDPNVVWCRNDILKIDYEITRHPGSYQHEVMGIPEEAAYDPPRKFNKGRAAQMEEAHGNRNGKP